MASLPLYWYKKSNSLWLHDVTEKARAVWRRMADKKTMVATIVTFQGHWYLKIYVCRIVSKMTPKWSFSVKCIQILFMDIYNLAGNDHVLYPAQCKPTRHVSRRWNLLNQSPYNSWNRHFYSSNFNLLDCWMSPYFVHGEAVLISLMNKTSANSWDQDVQDVLRSIPKTSFLHERASLIRDLNMISEVNGNYSSITFYKLISFITFV